ncbi:hypothetical protein BG000_003288, partial [Podila horticola]
MTMQVDKALVASTASTAAHTKLTRLCDAVSEHYYIYLTIEMESQDATKKGSHIHLSILTLRAMLTSAPTFSPTTAGSAVVRCHALDLNQLWNALTLFNTLVNDYEARFEIRHVASTLLGLQANSRQL